MPENPALASQIEIKLNGSTVQQVTMEQLLTLVVDQSVHVPDMFSLRFNDSGLTILDEGPFDLTKEVEISAQKEGGEKVTLIKGEITAIEPYFEEGMLAEVVIRGFDKTHRMFREAKSSTFVNKKDSDLANEIAQAHGLQAEVESTATVYDHIFQDNQSDLDFLMGRAWRIGYECFVQEGKLHFRKPPGGSGQTALTWGDDLQSFRPRMTLAEQVDEVIVKGWDVDKKEPIVGQAQDGELYPNISESQNGASWASNFGTGKRIYVNQSVVSQSEADALANARLNEISGSFIDAEGEAFRRPDIKAGQLLTLNALGDRFSGDYLVTQAIHHYSSEGLRTSFFVKGSRTGMLQELFNEARRPDRWPGVYTAIVTNTDDPQDWGRVKLKFPWLTDDAESDWARVIGLGAGPEAGLYIMPEVDDEVIVAFTHGQFSRPVVIGGLWNGQTALPPEASGASSGEKPLVRTWHSRTGHLLAMHDDADNKIEVATAGGHNVTLDDANKKITITSSGGLSITLDDNSSKIVFESGADIEMKASGNLKIEASGNMDLNASGQMNIKGAMINLN